MAPKPFRVEALLPVPAATYFLERDSAAFRSLLSKVLKIGQLTFNDLWHEGASSYVRMVTKPEFGSWVPKSVAGQLQSSNLEFHDIIEYNPAYIAAPPYRIFVRTESPFLKDKLDIQLTLTIEEVEPGVSCRQILEGHIRVKMFGVGRIVEGIVKESLDNTYKKLPEIVRRWQLFREEALRSGDGRQLLVGRPPVGCEVSWIRHEVLAILKKPLPEEDPTSPVSALCHVADASEDSEDSAGALARAQQRAAAQQRQQAAATAEAEAVFVAAAAGARQQQQREAAMEQQQASAMQQQQESEEQAVDELRRQVRRDSEYYDAEDRVCCDVAEDEEAHTQRAQQGGTFPTAAAPAEAAGASLPSRVGSLEAAAPSQPRSLAALAAAALARGSHHRRALSNESATSTGTPTSEGGQAGAPGSRRFWRRFNKDYRSWETYWDEVGVEQEVEAEEGEEAAAAALAGTGVVARALHAVEEVMQTSYYSTSILVALFLLRRGWLHVDGPDAQADAHEEEHRHHEGHRHRRTVSGSGAASMGSAPSDSQIVGLAAGTAGAAAEADGGLPAAAVGPAHVASLARVAQEVCGRMVSGPRRAVVAAGSSVRQASIAPKPLARPNSTLGMLPSEAAVGRPPASVAFGGSAALEEARALASSMAARHRKTMSLDTGTAIAAREAAADALLEQQRQRQRRHPQADSAAAAAAGAQRGVYVGAGGATREAVVVASSANSSAAPALGAASWTPRRQLERRPSDLAAATAMASMQRADNNHVRGPSRLSCFGGCRRPPAVKD